MFLIQKKVFSNLKKISIGRILDFSVYVVLAMLIYKIMPSV